jgi:hypothetical protein
LDHATVAVIYSEDTDSIAASSETADWLVHQRVARITSASQACGHNCTSSYNDLVNFNVYIDDVTAERLKRLARKTGATRNALVRKAIAVYLDRGTSEWPALVSGYEGDESLHPFEEARRELAVPVDDPFATRRGRRAPRIKRKT